MYHRESEALMVAIRLWLGAAIRYHASLNPPGKSVGHFAGRAAVSGANTDCSGFGYISHSRSAFDLIHQAVSARRVLALHYRDEAGHLSSRDIQPLSCFSGEALAAWLHGVETGRRLSVFFASIAVYKITPRLTGDFVKQSTVLC